MPHTLLSINLHHLHLHHLEAIVLLARTKARINLQLIRPRLLTLITIRPGPAARVRIERIIEHLIIKRAIRAKRPAVLVIIRRVEVAARREGFLLVQHGHGFVGPALRPGVVGAYLWVEGTGEYFAAHPVRRVGDGFAVAVVAGGPGGGLCGAGAGGGFGGAARFGGCGEGGGGGGD